jgi:hypothetical protein
MVALIFAEIVSSSLRDRRAALANSFKHQAHFAGDRTADGRKKENSTSKKRRGAILIPEQRKRFKFHTTEIVLT